MIFSASCVKESFPYSNLSNNENQINKTVRKQNIINILVHISSQFHKTVLTIYKFINNALGFFCTRCATINTFSWPGDYPGEYYFL